MKSTLIIASLFLCISGLSAQEIVTSIPGTEVTFDMVLIPAGELYIHSQKVRLDSFWIGKHEVTFDEFVLFQDRESDSAASVGEMGFDADAITRPTPQYLDYTFGMGRHGGFPAVSMTQQAAVRYCEWLYQKTGIFYRLPTEAEWEYACQKGETDYQSDRLDEIAWHYDNSFEKYHKTGQKEANAIGLFDMLGNVSEWTADYYLSDQAYDSFLKDSTNVNPWIIPKRRHSRTVKGGAYDDNPEDCSCSSRLKSKPKWQARDPQIPKSEWWNPDSPFVGFRIVRPAKQPDKASIEAYYKKAVKY